MREPLFSEQSSENINHEILVNDSFPIEIMKTIMKWIVLGGILVLLFDLVSGNIKNSFEITGYLLIFISASMMFTQTTFVNGKGMWPVVWTSEHQAVIDNENQMRHRRSVKLVSPTIGFIIGFIMVIL